VEGTLGQVPREPRVDRADAQVALAPGVVLVEQVRDLGGRGVGGHAQPVGLEHQTGADGAQVLPSQRRPDRFARGSVPHDRGRALVRDADRLDGAALRQHRARDLQRDVGHPGGVELHEPGRRGVRQQLAVALDGDRGVGSHDGGPQAARPHVDD
jgi:hypothetical protein